MHPLDVRLDDSAHHVKPRQGGRTDGNGVGGTGTRAGYRRRSSLDNSCLAAADTFRHVVGADELIDVDSPHRSQRRLSLNATTTTTATFLSTLRPDSNRGPKLDLDCDWHSSLHSNTRKPAIGKRNSYRSGHSTDSLSSSPHSKSDEDVADGQDDDSESSLESDADSFCDASVQEPANKEYLRKDLGASCFWGSTDNCYIDFDVDDFQAELDKGRGVATQIITEGVEMD